MMRSTPLKKLTGLLALAALLVVPAAFADQQNADVKMLPSDQSQVATQIAKANMVPTAMDVAVVNTKAAVENTCVLPATAANFDETLADVEKVLDQNAQVLLTDSNKLTVASWTTPWTQDFGTALASNQTTATAQHRAAAFTGGTFYILVRNTAAALPTNNERASAATWTATLANNFDETLAGGAIWTITTAYSDQTGLDGTYISASTPVPVLGL